LCATRYPLSLVIREGVAVAADQDDDQRKSDERDLVDGQLPMTARQEQLSLAFVRMITYEAGCAVKTHDTDYDGVDITLTSSAQYAVWYGAEFELQLKATTQQRYLRDDHLAWPMKRKPYQKLTKQNRYNRAYLGVLLLPPEAEKWLVVEPRRLIFEGRMFWEAASAFDQIADGVEEKTVHLPRSNVFDREQLLGIMKTIGDGEEGPR
jgi:hypothetical protein